MNHSSHSGIHSFQLAQWVYGIKQTRKTKQYVITDAGFSGCTFVGSSGRFAVQIISNGLDLNLDLVSYLIHDADASLPAHSCRDIFQLGSSFMSELRTWKGGHRGVGDQWQNHKEGLWVERPQF